MSKILVIDDDAIIRKVCEKILKRNGHEVLTSCDGENGLAVFKKTLTDLIILDVNMPGLSGGETFKKIRELSKKVFVIILTGSDIPEDIKSCSGVFTHVMSKGDGMSCLLSKVNEFVENE